MIEKITGSSNDATLSNDESKLPDKNHNKNVYFGGKLFKFLPTTYRNNDSMQNTQICVKFNEKIIRKYHMNKYEILGTKLKCSLARATNIDNMKMEHFDYERNA